MFIPSTFTPTPRRRINDIRIAARVESSRDDRTTPGCFSLARRVPNPFAVTHGHPESLTPSTPCHKISDVSPAARRSLFTEMLEPPAFRRHFAIEVKRERVREREREREGKRATYGRFTRFERRLVSRA